MKNKIVEFCFWSLQTILARDISCRALYNITIGASGKSFLKAFCYEKLFAMRSYSSVHGACHYSKVSISLIQFPLHTVHFTQLVFVIKYI